MLSPAGSSGKSERATRRTPSAMAGLIAQSPLSKSFPLRH
jgi:hypothetical protein